MSDGDRARGRGAQAKDLTALGFSSFHISAAPQLRFMCCSSAMGLIHLYEQGYGLSQVVDEGDGRERHERAG